VEVVEVLLNLGLLVLLEVLVEVVVPLLHLVEQEILLP
tara:strand:+ start:248 stop:361 length:114 start_codon:yes stop_codon:yes gene_type:complete